MTKIESESGTDARLEKDSAAFYDAMSELIRVYQFRDRDRICCYGISVTQCYTLDVLFKSGPLTMNELASRLYLDKSTASRVVSTMERKELIVRRPSSEDRRSVLLDDTSKGRDLYQRIRRDIEERDKKLIADFAPAVRKGMIELLRRLTKAADERARACAPSGCSSK